MTMATGTAPQAWRMPCHIENRYEGSDDQSFSETVVIATNTVPLILGLGPERVDELPSYAMKENQTKHAALVQR